MRPPLYQPSGRDARSNRIESMILARRGGCAMFPGRSKRQSMRSRPNQEVCKAALGPVVRPRRQHAAQDVVDENEMMAERGGNVQTDETEQNPNDSRMQLADRVHP